MKYSIPPRAAAFALPCFLFACQGEPEEQNHSGATNWLRCDTAADCAEAPGSSCGADGYCLDSSGNRIEQGQASGADDDTGPTADDTVADDRSDDDATSDDDSTADDDAVTDDSTSDDDSTDDDMSDDDAADDDTGPTPSASATSPGPTSPDASAPVAQGGGGSTSGPDPLPVGGSGGAASCEYDSCHPERCDEEGEPCCDPFPGDGPNYCNAGLTCEGASCILRAETTTPEVLERNACEQTGGTWDYGACGHYTCGAPNDCDAIVPGCDCGTGRNFTNENLGCQDDPSCHVGDNSFGCGELLCETIDTEYCEASMNGVGVTTYSCEPIPEPCLDDRTCECMLEYFGETVPPTQCSLGAAGELVILPPSGP